LIVQERHDPGDVVSPGTETGIDAYREVAPNVPLSTGPRLAEVLQPGVDSPSPGEIWSSQPPDEATTETQQSEIKMVVNARQSMRRHLPAPKVTHTLPIVCQGTNPSGCILRWSPDDVVPRTTSIQSQ
jgi:hypothetical protein